MTKISHHSEESTEIELADVLARCEQDGFELVSVTRGLDIPNKKPLLLVFKKVARPLFDYCDAVVKHELVSEHVAKQSRDGWRLVAAVNITELADNDFLYRLFFERQAG